MGTQVYKNKKGKRCPSVTTLISSNLGWNKQTLMRWQSKIFNENQKNLDDLLIMHCCGNIDINPIRDYVTDGWKTPDKISKEACDVGTLCHLYCECYIRGIKVPSEELQKHTMEEIVIAEAGVEQFKLATQKLGFVWEEPEQHFVSENHQYGGTMDLVYTRNGKKGLGDIKTSKGVYTDYLIQLGAYDHLLEECANREQEEYCVIKISKDIMSADDEIIKIFFLDKEMIQEGWEIFKQLRWLHEQNKKLSKYVKKL